MSSSDFDYELTSPEIYSTEFSSLDHRKRVPMFCMTLDLPDGYHIFKIQLARTLSDMLFPKAEYSYTWAYEVKSDTH